MCPSYTDTDLGGGGALGMSGPPPLEFSKYTSQRTTFSVLSGVFLHAHFKNVGSLRSPAMISVYIYVLSPPFNDLADCLGNVKVVHRSYTFYIFAEQPNPRRISQYTPTSVNVSKYGGAKVAEWLSSWLAEQEVRGSIPGHAT